MDVNQPLTLLAGLSPSQFMRQHWQKKPLLIRQALPDFRPLLSRSALFALAANAEVESRLIVREASGWHMKNGPIAARSLPPVGSPGWTLLVQSVDAHDAGAYRLLQQFRFLPDARLDDLMISYATPGGGVGPHFDSYDVFLLQASGQRRWQIGRQKDLSLQPGVPLKILRNFEPDQEFVLNPGDMLYLPPAYAHDGVAVDTGDSGHAPDCMTYSIGFRAPGAGELAARLLHRLADFEEDALDDASDQDGKNGKIGKSARFALSRLYRDRDQNATNAPAAVPEALVDFAKQAVLDALGDPLALACALGESITEPKSSTYFDPPMNGFSRAATGLWMGLLRLDARTRMLYDKHHVFMNGESYRAKGADATLMRRLADQRELSAKQLAKASPDAVALLSDWYSAGWLHEEFIPRKS